MPASRRPPGSLHRGAVLLLFLLSGATSLVYEVSWTRRLVLLVGSTSSATALLLAAFMLGLALGARWGGPPADRARSPLRLYAGLEAAAALLALLLPFLLDALAGAAFLTAAGREGLLFSLAFLLLLLPTTLLGATLPALSRALVEDPALVGPRIGMLYAANTLGAVAGAVGAGFFLVEALGVDGSARAAVGVNLLVAGAAWGLARREAAPAAGAAAAAPTGTGGDGGGVREPGPRVLRAAALAAFAGGFVGLAAEVVWTRLLVFVLQGFTATFAAMLGAFLLGSALGGAVFGRVAGRSARPLVLLAGLQLAVGVAAAGALVVLHHQYDAVQWLRGATAIFDGARANHRVVLLSAAFLVLGPPAFLMGGIFPVAARAAAGGLGDLGERVGRLYAANTVGAVLGSLAAGFLGVPLLGARESAAALALFSVAAGAGTLWLAGGAGEGAGRPALRWLSVGGAGAAAGALLLLGHPGEPMILRSHVFLGPRGRENRLVEAVEGRSGVASVVRNERNGFLSLYTDEFLAASTEGRYRYMRMLGHIPMVLAEDPRRVLVMAFGTGTTAGSLSTHPSVERLDIVEISREVLEVAPHFASVNRGVLERVGRGGRPEVRVFAEDARRFVLASRDEYDVITLEPLMPYTPGAVHLYTREFYELCRERLAPGGAMCQWIPVHALSAEDFAMLTRSFVEVFPATSLWFVEETVALVGTAGPGPQPLPVARSAERLAAPGPRADLEAGRLDDLAQWWAFRVCGGETLREWVRGVEPMTDERPLLEFRPVPTGTLTTFLHDNLVLALRLRDSEEILERVDLAGLPPEEAASFRERLAAADAAAAEYMDGRASEDLFGFHASHTRLEGSDAAREEHERRAVEALRTAVQRYGMALRRHPRDRIVADRWRNMEVLRLLNEGRALLRAGKAAEAGDAYLEATRVDAPWNRDEAWTGLGRALLREGKPVGARDALERALANYPGSRDAQALLGQALVALGRPGEARAWFERAYEGGSGPADEDTGMRNARVRALGAGEGGVGADGAGAGQESGAEAVRREEARRALREALDDAAGSGGERRRRAVAILRAAEGEDAAVLRDLLRPHRETVADPAQPAAERVRALSLLAAAADPGLAEAVLAVARDAGASGDGALAAAAADAAGDAADPVALAVLLDAAGGSPPAARARAADRLASLRDPRSVDALLDGLEDPDPAVRTAALAALFQLTGRKDFDPAAPPTARAAALDRLRSWWTTARPHYR